MSKKTWMIFGIVWAVVILCIIVLLIILIPQSKGTSSKTVKYESVARENYTFSGNSTDTLKREYSVTTDDVSKGKSTNKYKEGNINPFTPKSQVTIYNEPTYKPTNQNGSGSSLTPSDK